jgi:hypothetical protein
VLKQRGCHSKRWTTTLALTAESHRCGRRLLREE